MSSDINRVLNQVEQSLGIISAVEQPRRSRLKKALEKMLETLEEAHDIKNKHVVLNYRMSALRERLIAETMRFLKVELPNNLSQVSRIHMLKDIFASNRWRNDTPAASHKKQWYYDAAARVRYRQLKLATNLIAIGDQSFDHNLSQEEAIELVEILENEICGYVSIKPPDIIMVGAGLAIDAAEYLPMYRANKRSAIHALKMELRHRLEKRLLELERSCQTTAVKLTIAQQVNG